MLHCAFTQKPPLAHTRALTHADTHRAHRGAQTVRPLGAASLRRVWTRFGVSRATGYAAAAALPSPRMRTRT